MAHSHKLVHHFLVAVLLCACDISIPPHANPEKYARTCSVDGDCVLVFQKDCSYSGCHCGADGVLNREGAADFNAEESKVQCVPAPPLGGQCNCGEARSAVCRSGACEAANP